MGNIFNSSNIIYSVSIPQAVSTTAMNKVVLMFALFIVWGFNTVNGKYNYNQRGSDHDTDKHLWLFQYRRR